MLTVERIKEIIDDPSLSDEELEQIRDELRCLAELIFIQIRSEQINSEESR